MKTLFHACWLAAALALPLQAAQPLQFRIQLLCIDANEGCDIADVNKDGKLDIIAGRNWYAGPDFIPRPLRLIEDWNGYVQSNGDFAYDVDRDGWIDVISGSYIPSQVYWYRNPGAEGLRLGKIWEQKLLIETGASQNEGQLLHDLDGDGVPEWLVNSWNKKTPLVAWKVPALAGKPGEPVKWVIGTQKNGHGIGVGDLNGDGLEDVLFEGGWYERPADPTQPWILHEHWQMHASLPMIVRDLDGDGKNDVIMGEGHNFGLYWLQQLNRADDGSIQWKKHEIDKSFSEVHCLHMADLDGDGTPELITGKRYYAHNGKDPGGMDPPCLYYFKWNAAEKKFTRFTIDEGRVGTGLQIRTADLNGNGRLDIVVAGKSGTYVIFNEGPKR